MPSSWPCFNQSLLVYLVPLYLVLVLEQLGQELVDVLEVQPHVHLRALLPLHHQDLRHGSKVGVQEEEELVAVDASSCLEAKHIHDRLQVGLIGSLRQGQARYVQLRGIDSISFLVYLLKPLVSKARKTPLRRA